MINFFKKIDNNIFYLFLKNMKKETPVQNSGLVKKTDSKISQP